MKTINLIHLLHEKHIIDELLFREKRNSFAYTNQVQDNRSFSLVTDYEVNMEANEEIDKENIKSIFTV
jgi:hypothetical protein